MIYTPTAIKARSSGCMNIYIKALLIYIPTAFQALLIYIPTAIKALLIPTATSSMCMPRSCSSSAYVSTRQHTSAYVSIRQHMPAYVSRPIATSIMCMPRSCSPCIRVGLYLEITSPCPNCPKSLLPHMYTCIRQHTAACVSIRQHT